MERRGQRTFTLRIDVDAEPITGDVANERGEATAFSGWLGLAQALGILQQDEQARPGGGERKRGGVATHEPDAPTPDNR